ncbi:MAG: hypothetical protein NTX71_08500, partial [Candidatus Aureabacteria bacterium]|nr:hypothetical protein [Candidatus Auribacterota bacterium]
GSSLCIYAICVPFRTTDPFHHICYKDGGLFSVAKMFFATLLADFGFNTLVKSQEANASSFRFSLPFHHLLSTQLLDYSANSFVFH